MTQEAVGFEHVKDVPIVNPDFELFVDASQYQKDDGWFYTGYAVVTQHEVVIAKPLPPNLSAQEAELKALTEAEVAEGKTANIYTDSRYVFGIAHDWGPIWRAKAFLTSSSKPIKNADSVRHLMDALQLPTGLGVIKVKAHTKADTPKARGNARADAAAKAAARWPTGKDTVSIQAVSLASPLLLMYLSLY
ncbi:RNase H, partial [Pristimantis euphronides]